MNVAELVVFIIYFVFMVGIGIYFFAKSKGDNEKDYFLGGRQMGPWVSALSAGASDMSAWVLMGLPASVYALGMGQIWIAVGLAIGYALSWIFEAPRLRKFSIAAKDSITIPQYLTNRFLSKSKFLQIICAIIFLVAYTIYAASSIKACGTLFSTVIGINETTAMYLAAFIIIAYTFLGGFNAVCWTDFFQGLLMLAALLIAPIFALALVNGGEAVAARLGIGVYDKQLINLAAEQSGICPEIFEKADEKESRNLFATFIGYLRSPFVGSEYSGSNVLSSDALFKIQSDVIRDLASRESCVFVGRCADYILRDHPRTVNIFIAAGRAERIERLCRLHGIAPGEAESLMDRTDARRAAYYNYYSSGTWGMAETYDLCIDSSVLGIDGTTGFVLEFVERKLGVKP